MAYIPNQVNEGGSTGGVSVMEPIPWYQANITSETSLGYPNGRLTPDISFNANVFPGAIFVFPGDEEGISGGTSESSPLFAGLLTLVMGAIHNSTGLINPALYSLAQNPTDYAHAFYPINFGYNDPWTASPSLKYNLITGLGSLNIAYFASELLPGKPILN